MSGFWDECPECGQPFLNSYEKAPPDADHPRPVDAENEYPATRDGAWQEATEQARLTVALARQALEKAQAAMHARTGHYSVEQTARDWSGVASALREASYAADNAYAAYNHVSSFDW